MPSANHDPPAKTESKTEADTGVAGLFQAFRIDPGVPAAAPHALGPQFWHEAIARRWLCNYLIYSADNLEMDGRPQTAAAFRAAAVTAERQGEVTIGQVRYQVRRTVG
ncbi:hypothetical protein SMC26_27625 [Actinomadura fulvescens]